MKEKLADIRYWLAVHGLWTGLTLGFTVLLWDVFLKGARHLLHYSIGGKGAVVLLVSYLLITGYVIVRFVEYDEKW